MSRTHHAVILGSMLSLVALDATDAQTRTKAPVVVTPATPVTLPRKFPKTTGPAIENPRIDGTLAGISLAIECQVVMKVKPFPHGPLTPYRTGNVRFRMGGALGGTTQVEAYPSISGWNGPDESQTFVAGKATNGAMIDPSQPLHVQLSPNAPVLSPDFTDLGGGLYRYTGAVPACPQGWV